MKEFRIAKAHPAQSILTGNELDEIKKKLPYSATIKKYYSF